MTGALLPCGTRAAYVRHVRAGERPCPECRAANADYMRRRRLRSRKLVVLRPHGTLAALRRHYRRGERPCPACRAAQRAADVKRRTLGSVDNSPEESARPSC